MDDLTLFELIERETDPELRRVLEHYRAAEIELASAGELLGKMNRSRWQLAVLSRANDVAWQAQRYMRLERERQTKLQDFESDAPTNPRGYAWQRIDPTPLTHEVVTTVEAVLDTDPAPRPRRWLDWSIHAGMWLLIIVTLWLLRHYARTL